MPRKLHIDIETFSSEDITNTGSYKYFESPDFEIILLAYAFDDEPIKIIDMAQGEAVPPEFWEALQDPKIEKHAHNANFERNAFKKYGYDVPAEQWFCSSVKAAYCGYPLSLGDISGAMGLGEKGKLSTGKALIRFFCTPQKPTKKEPYKLRKYPVDDLEKWGEFKLYCINDVEAEREIVRRLEGYDIPETERRLWILDQKINDTGVKVDVNFAKNAVDLDAVHSGNLHKKLKNITGLENPNSQKQLTGWLSDSLQEDVTSLAKDNIEKLSRSVACPEVLEVLDLRKKSSKTSTKKYLAMIEAVCEDGRVRGILQFYGASRTGRWAGRIVQPQNLPQIHLQDLDLARTLVAEGDYDKITMFYDDLSSILSQTIRTALVAPEGKTLAVSDFSAIEARVLAWLADEKWRLDVFASHGKIYEASASMMFNVPIEKVTKGSEYRDRGKISELALGYQGALGAMKTMGGEKMGLSDSDMTRIVNLWRAKNQRIVGLWQDINDAAIVSTKLKKRIVLSGYRDLVFDHDGQALSVTLPSGRKLIYQNAELTKGRFGQVAVRYKSMNLGKWGWVESYGGKFVENIVQAIARDLLALSIQKLDVKKFKIILHVHDEIVAEVDAAEGEKQLKLMESVMSEPVPWAEGLPLSAEGFVSEYYKKD